MSGPSQAETLRRLWSLSMHGHCPIWLGGEGVPNDGLHLRERERRMMGRRSA